MGRGEAEGGDVTKVEHPMPPYGLLQAEDDKTDEPERKKTSKRSRQDKGWRRRAEAKRRAREEWEE